MSTTNPLTNTPSYSGFSLPKTTATSTLPAFSPSAPTSAGDTQPKTQTSTKIAYAGIPGNYLDLNKSTGTGTILPQPTAPATVAGINQVPGVKLPTGTMSSGNISNATASAVGQQTGLAALIQQQQEAAAQAQQQAAALQKEQQNAKKSVLNLFNSTPTTADSRANAYAGINVNPANYFADQQAKIAEIGSLTGDYNAKVAARDQAVMAAQENAGGQLTSFLDSTVNKIKNQAAIELNQMSANINAKSAVLQALQGNFHEATNFVNQAVEDATADTKFKFDSLKLFYDMNQDSITSLDKKYQDATQNALSLAKDQYDRSYDEAKLKGQFVIEAAKQGVDLSGYMNGSLENIQKAFGQSVSGTNTGNSGSASFGDIIQQALDAGATPEQAAREAATASENLGVQVDQKQLNSWVSQARSLTPNIAPAATPQTEDKTVNSIFKFLFE